VTIITAYALFALAEVGLEIENVSLFPEAVEYLLKMYFLLINPRIIIALGRRTERFGSRSVL